MRLLLGEVCWRRLAIVVLSLMSLTFALSCGGDGDRLPEVADLAMAPPNPSFDELVGVSPVVFTGIVSGVEYGSHPSSPYPFTFVTFSRVEFLRGESKVPMTDGNLTLSYMGGMLPDHTIIESDELPQLDLGDWYLIFLRGGGWRLSPIAAGGRAIFRLHGSLKEDPYIMSLTRTPVARIEDGRLVFAKPSIPGRDPEVIDRPDRPEASEKPVSAPEGVRRLSQAQRERIEDSLLRMQRRRVDSVGREAMDIDPFLAKWGKAMTLSELRKEISSRERLTQEKYPRFTEVFLQPVPTEKGMQPVAPKTEVDDE